MAKKRNVEQGSQAKEGKTKTASKKPRAKKVNPIQIQKYLKGIDYPAHKQDIIEYAQEEGADERIMDVLNGLPDRQFGTPADVSKALGEVQ